MTEIKAIRIEPKSKEGICIRIAECCTLSPRCENCPEPCADLECPHWKTCDLFTPGQPKPKSCSKCGKVLEEDEIGMAWKMDEDTGEVQEQYFFCDSCLEQLVISSTEEGGTS